MTYPLIGNYGRIAFDDQSGRPWLRGLIVGHATAAVLEPARQLVELLRAHGVPAIAGLDTRRLARRLRETGSQRALITAPGDTDATRAVDAACSLTRWEDEDFVGQVSAIDPHEVGPSSGPLVAVIDYGLKENIVRQLVARGARVRVLPYTTDASTAIAPDVRGLVLSPGPGDPARLDGPVRLAQAAIEDGRPLLGICLGHQIVGRAAGAATRRLRFGHHGANHPVLDEETGKVQVTAQNHEVEVVGESLPPDSGFVVSQRNLNDGSVEGLRHLAKPIETVQYHPEGSPGPLDALEVFDRFMSRL
jgi:carbamoyl-phosphate synthase small subunit